MADTSFFNKILSQDSITAGIKLCCVIWKLHHKILNIALRMEKNYGPIPYTHRNEGDSWRHKCGCIRTSDKLKQILKNFPSTPPPSPSTYEFSSTTVNNTCISAYCTGVHQPLQIPTVPKSPMKELAEPSLPLDEPKPKVGTKTWRVVGEVVQLLQLSVTATALALYYLIYCYMQLIYYTLRSALYFHNADGPMKITIGVVTLSSLVVGFNLLLRMERFIGIFQ